MCAQAATPCAQAATPNLCAGMGFYGHWKNAGSYLTCSAQLGWLCLGCDLTAAPEAACEEVQAAADSGADGGELTVVPRDAFGRKLYLQPLGLLLEVIASVAP